MFEQKIEKVLVISPHPDDETLGVGGTIARLIDDGKEVHVLVVSGHLPPLYPPEVFKQTESELYSALLCLGVSRDFVHLLRVPATFVRDVPIAELNEKISAVCSRVKPDAVFCPFVDRHIDHRIIFDSVMVATRPVGSAFPRIVFCYETLSETFWNAVGIEPQFQPNFFVDISKFVDQKIAALECFKSQITDNPSRDVEATKALGKLRGSQNGCDYAESFVMIRCIV